MRACLVLLAFPMAIMATALAVNGAIPQAVLSCNRHYTGSFLILSAIQLYGASLAAAIIAVAVSVAGSLVRRLARLAGLCLGGGIWRGLTAEGLAVGLLVTGAYLGWAPKDTYESPHGPQSVAVRMSSLIEEPLGIGPSSDCFVGVTVTWRDGEGHSVVQKSSEGRYRTAVGRITTRVVSWSDGVPSRAVVLLPDTGRCLFLPERVEGARDCPPDSVVQAYLRGAPLAEVGRLCQEEAERRRAEVESP